MNAGPPSSQVRNMRSPCQCAAQHRDAVPLPHPPPLLHALCRRLLPLTRSPGAHRLPQATAAAAQWCCMPRCRMCRSHTRPARATQGGRRVDMTLRKAEEHATLFMRPGWRTRGRRMGGSLSVAQCGGACSSPRPKSCRGVLPACRSFAERYHGICSWVRTQCSAGLGRCPCPRTEHTWGAPGRAGTRRRWTARARQTRRPAPHARAAARPLRTGPTPQPAAGPHQRPALPPRMWKGPLLPLPSRWRGLPPLPLPPCQWRPGWLHWKRPAPRASCAWVGWGGWGAACIHAKGAGGHGVGGTGPLGAPGTSKAAAGEGRCTREARLHFHTMYHTWGWGRPQVPAWVSGPTPRRRCPLHRHGRRVHSARAHHQTCHRPPTHPPCAPVHHLPGAQVRHVGCMGAMREP